MDQNLKTKFKNRKNEWRLCFDYIDELWAMFLKKENFA